MDAVIVLLILLFVLLAIGVPVGFAIGGATMISMFFFSDLNMVVNAQYCYSGIFSFTVMAIPYFMLAGTIMSTGGIARRIVDFASALIDFVTGALGCVSMLACMFFGALTGSGMATTSAIGGMMIPEMMLMYGKEASNRKQEIDRQHYTIPNQRPKDKHCGKI